MGDIDGDGLRDVITEISDWTSNGWEYSYQLYINQGDNTFKEDNELLPKFPKEHRIGRSGFSLEIKPQIAICDFDNDGKLDAAVYKYDDLNRLEYHSILWNDGSLTPTVCVTHESNYEGKAAIMDFDNNGLDDLVIGGTGEYYIVHMLPNRKFEIESRNVPDIESQVARLFVSPKFYNSKHYCPLKMDGVKN